MSYVCCIAVALDGDIKIFKNVVNTKEKKISQSVEFRQKYKLRRRKVMNEEKKI